MARPASITEADVESAVVVLNDNGKPINPYQVRKHLGKGSIAKIAYYLKALGVDAVYETDDPLTVRLASLLRPAALEIEEQTSERIRKETEELRTRIQDRDDALADLDTRLQAKESELQDKKERLAQAGIDSDWLRSEKQALELKVARLDEAQNSLAKQLSEKKDRITEYKESSAAEKKELQTTLFEHKEAVRMMREDHQQTIDDYKNMVSSLTEKLHEMAESSKKVVSHNAELKLQVEKMSADRRIEAHAAEEQIETLRLEMAKGGEEIKVLVDQCNVLQMKKTISLASCS